jgi:hypothetical protein
MIAIPCSNCNRMIDIDTQVEPIKVTCYLMMCRECQIDTKNRERDIKLNNMSMKEKFKIDRLKYEKSLISKYGDGFRTYSHGTYSDYPYTPGSNTQIKDSELRE